MLNKIIHNKYFYKYFKLNRIQQLNRLFLNRIVQGGPFSGMIYSKLEANCSAFYPKMIGSYESELHPIINKISSLNLDRIYDIGCAEGYYAIGFALKFPTIKIHAFDSNEKALDNCRENAKINKLLNVKFHGIFDTETLQALNFNNSLIVCDCEGYESEIFIEKNIEYFKNSFILVETHDFKKIDITKKLKGLFSLSHKIIEFHSTSDFYKVFYYKFHNPSKLDILTRWYLYAEHRPSIMSWLYLEPLNR
jgi:hypothetical protein